VGANAQVMFREKVALGGSLADATSTYGDSTSNMPTCYPNCKRPTLMPQSWHHRNSRYLQNRQDRLDGRCHRCSMATALGVTANMSKAGHLKASTTGYAMDVTGNNYNLSGVSAKLTVGQLALTRRDH
jgi:hypothetical protein